MIEDTTSIKALGGSKLFLIPADLYKDSAFPFKDDEEMLRIAIVKDTVVIEKIKNK